MAISVGSHELGPDNGTLSVRTKKGGAAGKAGHDLLIEVASWSATLTVGADGAQTMIELTADGRSLEVREGTGGVMPLGDHDKIAIKQTIDKQVLKGTSIAFRSTAVDGEWTPAGATRMTVSGELELAGRRRQIAFELNAGADGTFTAAAALRQSNWGIKPYSALFGTLKVLDEVTVEVTAEVPRG